MEVQDLKWVAQAIQMIHWEVAIGFYINGFG